MATYYCDTAAAGGGDGSASTPFNSLDTAWATMLSSAAFESSGLYWAGAARTKLKTAYPGFPFFLAQWPGRHQATLRGDTPVTGWAGAAGVYSVTLPSVTGETVSGDYVSGVVLGWDKRVDKRGRHYGHLLRAANVGECIDGANKWFYEPSTRLLTVGVSSGTYADAAAIEDDKISWCRGNCNGIEIGTPTFNDPYTSDANVAAFDGTICQGIVIDGIHVMLFCDPGTDQTTSRTAFRSIGYGIRIADAQNCVVRNCKTIDCGYHGIGAVGNISNSNTIEDCEVWGGNGDATNGGSSFVWGYCGAAGSGSKYIDNTRVRRCTAYTYGLLGLDGNPIAGTIPYDGFLNHTDNSSGTDDGNLVRDVEYSDCKVVHSGKLSDNTLCPGSDFYTQSCINPATSGIPSDETDYRTYPMRVIASTVINGNRNLTAGYSAVAFHRCRLEYTRAGLLGSGTNGVFGSTSGTNKTLASACEIIINLDSAGTRPFVHSTTTNKVLLRNCSVLVVGSDSNAGLKYIYSLANSAAARIWARGCVFAFLRTDRLATGDGTHGLVYTGLWESTAVAVGADGKAPLDIRDSCYYNVSVSSYYPFGGTSPAMNSETNWLANGDTLAYLPGRNSGKSWDACDSSSAEITAGKGMCQPFAEASGMDDALCAASGLPFTLELSAFARTKTTCQTQIVGGVGYNGRAWTGNYGANQYGSQILARGSSADATGVGSDVSTRGRPMMGVR